MVVRYLKYYTTNVTYTYCQRSEGHGISNQLVDEDVDLLIIVDSSTNETEVCKILKEDCLDVVILDHHPKIQDNPYALITNPQMDDYPSKELSGGGVVFKLLEVMDNMRNKYCHQQFIDLAGIAIYGDVMSMREGENRYFVYQALKNIRNPGIKAILEKQRIYLKDINSQTIGYKIAPVINATARMDKIELIIDLLLEDDYDKCLEMAKECIKLNEDRKKKEEKLFKAVKDKLDTSNKIIILQVTDKDKIDKGFNGLLAMKIADRYKKPTLVLKNKDGICSGSGRSIDDIEFKELLEETGLCNLLEGHSAAFGAEIKEDNINKLYEIFNEKLEHKKEKTITYDIELDIDEVTHDLIKDVEKFNYLSGKDAETTRVCIKNLPVNERKVMGKGLDTIKISTGKLDFMKFKTNEFYAEELCAWDNIDVICTLNVNKWWHNGYKQWIENLQGFLEDYRLSN